MYGSPRVDGRTMIRIGAQPDGAPAGNKMAPICSVPIKTTATLNIQLFPILRDNRTQPPATGSNVPMPPSNGLSVGRSESSASGDIVVRSPLLIQSSAGNDSNDADTKSNISTGSSDSIGRKSSMSGMSFETKAEVHLPPAQGSFEPPVGPSVPSSSITTSSKAVGSDEPELVKSIVHTDASVSTDSILSIYSAVNKSATTSSQYNHNSLSPSSTLASAASATEASVDTASASQEHFDDNRNVTSSSTVSDSASASVFSYTPTADDHQVSGGKQLSDISYSNDSRYKHLDEDETTDCREDNSPLGEDRVDIDDDSDDESSTFRFLGWDVVNEKSSLRQGCRRVLVLKDSQLALMFKASCASETAGNNPRLLNLMADIAENCAKRLRLMRDIAVPHLSAQHMDSLPLNDGRTTGDHLTEISKVLGENITITDVVYRFQPEDPSIYIGTYVQDKILSRPQYAIGSAGVLAVLIKKNKYATVEAFSDQLCEHIARTCPSALGSFQGDRRAGRVTQCRRNHPNYKDEQLMLQSFIFDPTIIVAEAARRCFVTVDDFLLFR